MHPWEFYEYDLVEYKYRRRGRSKELNEKYKRQIIASIVPYMDKKEQSKVINDAFSDEKPLSLKERYERTKQRYINAGILVENGK